MVRVKKLIGLLLITLMLVVAVIAIPMGTEKETYATIAAGRFGGIDVSNHNGVIDWAKAKANGVEFAIIRIGWGDDYKNQDDPNAEYNMQQCERFGIPYGVYIYSYALSTAEVDSEIAHTIRMIKGHNPTLGIWFDMEDADAYKARHNFNPYTHGKQLTDFCVRYVNGMKARGYSDVGVYANPDYFINVLDYNKINNAGMIWLAFWGSRPEQYGFGFDMWQYSATGTVNGLKGHFDMNYILPGSPLFTRVAAMPNKVEEFYRASGVQIVYGDVNGDSNISLSDLTRTKMHILGRLVLKGDAYTCADVNKDGKITLSDLTLMKQHILKRIDLTLPKEPEAEPEATEPEATQTEAEVSGEQKLEINAEEQEITETESTTQADANEESTESTGE